jgi:hypothetical protein
VAEAAAPEVEGGEKVEGGEGPPGAVSVQATRSSFINSNSNSTSTSNHNTISNTIHRCSKLLTVKRSSKVDTAGDRNNGSTAAASIKRWKQYQ